MLRPETGGQPPVLALDVVNDCAARPSQQRRHDETDALARSGRGEAQHMLGAVMTEIVALDPAEQDPIGVEQTGGLDLFRFSPTRRSIGGDILRLSRTKDRHADRDGDGDEAARSRDDRPFDEHLLCIGIVEIPPPEERWRIVDRPARHHEPWLAELRLKAELPRCPLRRRPCRQQNDDGNEGDLPPKNLTSAHTGSDRQKRRSRSENSRSGQKQQKIRCVGVSDTMAKKKDGQWRVERASAAACSNILR